MSQKPTKGKRSVPLTVNLRAGDNTPGEALGLGGGLPKGMAWGKRLGWTEAVRTTGACRGAWTTASSSLQGARASSLSRDCETDEVELASSKSS